MQTGAVFVVLGAVIFDRRNAADCLQWSTICCAGGAVRASTRRPH